MNNWVRILLVSIFCTGAAQAQPYTSQPIRIVVPYTVGTGNDILARIIGQQLSERWKSPFVIENRPGASGNIGTAQVGRSAPDGLTLLVTASNFVINPHIFKNAQYDPFKDLTPVAQLAWGRLLLVANPSARIANAKALVAAAQASPGKLTYASPGPGTPHHMAMELFKIVTESDILHIPYKGTAGAVTDLLSGVIHTMFLPIHVAIPHVREGKLSVLGLGSAKRSSTAPDVPTLGEQGLKGAEVDIWYAMYAPAGTPGDIVARLHAAVNSVLETPDVRTKLAGQGLEVETASLPALTDLMRRDSERWGQVVRKGKLSAD
jgi:tripartite-type tricarboxylate transporter receptor subunit TctC